MEATLNLIQGQKRLSEIPYYAQPQQQQQHQPHHLHQLQQQPILQSCQLQQRLGSVGFYSGTTQNEFFTAGPFEPVCSIKQEVDDDRLHQLTSLTTSTSLYATTPGSDVYTNPTETFLENLQSYFERAEAGSKINDDVIVVNKPSIDIDPLRRVMADFDRAASATLAQESDLVQAMLNFHCNSGRISKFDARRLITCLAEIFRQFASTQPAFLALSGADQFRLLVSSLVLVHEKSPTAEKS